jgi:hypothetical protein
MYIILHEYYDSFKNSYLLVGFFFVIRVQASHDHRHHAANSAAHDTEDATEVETIPEQAQRRRRVTALKALLSMLSLFVQAVVNGFVGNNASMFKARSPNKTDLEPPKPQARGYQERSTSDQDRLHRLALENEYKTTLDAFLRGPFLEVGRDATGNFSVFRFADAVSSVTTPWLFAHTRVLAAWQLYVEHDKALSKEVTDWKTVHERAQRDLEAPSSEIMVAATQMTTLAAHRNSSQDQAETQRNFKRKGGEVYIHNYVCFELYFYCQFDAHIYYMYHII